MTIPWLSRPATLREQPVSIRSLEAADRLGECLTGADPRQTLRRLRDVAIAEAQRRDSFAEWWRSRVCEEFFAADASGVPLPEGWETVLGLHFPFGPDHGPAKAFAGLSMAACVVPLDGTLAGETPGLMHVWLVADPDDRLGGDHHRRVTSSFWLDELRAQGLKMFLALSHDGAGERVSDRSWELGVALAKRALDSPRGPDRGGLLSQWLVSGVVSGDDVCGVMLGNKLEIETHRRWLLPSRNQNQIPVGFRPAPGYKLAHTLDAAWSLITGRGAVDGGRAIWNPGPVSIHAFVGESLQGLMQLAILARPEKAVLWHSSNVAKSIEPANKLRADLLRCLGMRRDSVQLRLADSASVAGAERRIGPEVEKDLLSDRRVLFNITGGNRLMAFAADALARRHHSMSLVYRDIDAAPLCFTEIRYDGLYPTTQTLEFESGVPRSATEQLFVKLPPPPPDRRWHYYDRWLENIFGVFPENSGS